ncbi:MAG: hypothetical protein WC373_13795 [Smithella sp.]|jgi:hypothetical protein
MSKINRRNGVDKQIDKICRGITELTKLFQKLYEIRTKKEK